MLYQPYSVIGFHSCDREVGLRVLNGEDELMASQNTWDWLGQGIYFWEQNPGRALEYAVESAERRQKNKIPINTPFVLGAMVELGNCLNLVDRDSLKVLRQAYEGLSATMAAAGELLPKNGPGNRALDCAVFQFIHRSNELSGQPRYDTVRCAFSEGEPAFEGSTISSRLHIQISVLNPACIKGYFLPRPLAEFNPSLKG